MAQGLIDRTTLEAATEGVQVIGKVFLRALLREAAENGWFVDITNDVHSFARPDRDVQGFLYGPGGASAHDVAFTRLGSESYGFMNPGLTYHTDIRARNIESTQIPHANVVAWGATGDGSTDDRSAFSDALAALKANGGGELFVPPGTYRLSTGISVSDLKGMTIRGVGITATTIKLDDVAARHFTFTAAEGITFRDLTFQGAGSTTASNAGSGVNMPLGGNSFNEGHRFVNVQFLETSETPIEIPTARGLVISNVKIDDCAVDMVDLTEPYSVSIHSLLMVGGQQRGLYVHGGGRDVDVYASRALQCGIGYEVDSGSVAFHSCTAEEGQNRSASYPGYGFVAGDTLSHVTLLNTSVISAAGITPYVATGGAAFARFNARDITAGVTTTESVVPHTLEVRNGEIPQAFRVYNTYTDDSNYERGLIGWDSNFFTIDTARDGTGNNQDVRIARVGVTQVDFKGALVRFYQDLDFNTDNTDDIGQSGARRPRTGYFGTSVVSPLFLAGDGAVGAPGMAFADEPTTGFYRGGASEVSLALGGLEEVTFGATNTTFRSNLVFGTDNTFDFGASGASRPRTGYFGTSVIAPLVNTDRVTTAGTLLLGAGGSDQWKIDTSGDLKPHVDNVDDLGTPANQVRTGYFGTSVQIGNAGALVAGDTHVLELRDGTNAQAFNVYNTYTDDANYERGVMFWSSDVFYLGTQRAGTGSTRAITFLIGNTAVWNISSGGHFFALADNAYDIGASGATRPRTLYLGTSLVVPEISISGRIVWNANAGIRTGNGTRGAPAWSFYNDTDSGLYMQSAGYFAFSHAGVVGTKFGPGSLGLGNGITDEAGSIDIRQKREIHTLAAAGTSDTVDIDIPDNARLVAVQFNVDDTVSDDGGDDTWSAAFIGGSTTAIISGAAAAINTKVNVFIDQETTNAETNIRFTANGGSFNGGIIEAVVYYIDLTSLADV